MRSSTLDQLDGLGEMGRSGSLDPLEGLGQVWVPGSAGWAGGGLAPWISWRLEGLGEVWVPGSAGGWRGWVRSGSLDQLEAGGAG